MMITEWLPLVDDHQVGIVGSQSQWIRISQNQRLVCKVPIILSTRYILNKLIDRGLSWKYKALSEKVRSYIIRAFPTGS